MYEDAVKYYRNFNSIKVQLELYAILTELTVAVISIP